MKKFCFTIILSSLFFFSCKEPAELLNGYLPIDPDVISLISSLGYDADDLVRIDQGYLVEGDILLTHELLEIISPSGLTRQTWYPATGIISDAYVGDVRVALGSDIQLENNSNVKWEELFKKAVDAWNTVPDSKLKLRYVTSSPYDVLVQDWAPAATNHNSNYTP